MAEGEPTNKTGEAVFTHLGADRDETGTTVYTRVQATDPQTAREAIDAFHELTGGTEVELIDMRPPASEGKPRGSTAFSSTAWNATWEPTGPTPPWGKKREN